MLQSIAKWGFLTVMQWIIVFVLILRKYYNQHNSNFKEQNAQKYIFLQWFLAIVLRFKKIVENNTNALIHRKIRIYDCYLVYYMVYSNSVRIKKNLKTTQIV